MLGNIILVAMFLGILLSLFIQESVTLEVGEHISTKVIESGIIAKFKSVKIPSNTMNDTKFIPKSKNSEIVKVQRIRTLDLKKRDRNFQRSSIMNISSGHNPSLSNFSEGSDANNNVESTQRYTTESRNGMVVLESNRMMLSEYTHSIGRERIKPINLETIQEDIAVDEDAKEKSISICDYLKGSSLFIFHKNWELRKFIASWVIPFDSSDLYSHKHDHDDVEIIDSSPTKRSFMNIKNIITESFEKKSIKKRRKRNIIFETIILLLIILAVVELILDDPFKDKNSTVRRICEIINKVTTWIFVIEALLKIIAMDFIWPSESNQTPYLGTGWNILDLIIVITSVVDILTIRESSILRGIKAIRALETFRYIKLVGGNEELKVLVGSVINVMPNIFIMLMFSFFYIFSFAIVTTFYFKGKMHSCDLPGIDNEEVL